ALDAEPDRRHAGLVGEVALRKDKHPVVFVVGVLSDAEHRTDRGRETDRADDAGEEVVRVALVQMSETDHAAAVALCEEGKPPDCSLHFGLAVRVDTGAEVRVEWV